MSTSDAQPRDGMAFAAELVLDPDDPADTDRVATEVAGCLGGGVDLAVVFVSALLDDPARHIMAARAALGARTLIGCDAAGVIARGHEIAHAPAVAIWTARLPGIEVVASHVTFGGESGDGEPLFPGEPAIQAGTAGPRRAGGPVLVSHRRLAEMAGGKGG